MDTNSPVVNAKSIEYDGLSTGFGGYMVDKDWQDRVKGMLKAELKRRNLSYKDLAEKLSAIGVVDSELNIKNKISRGGFTAVFLVQCLEAIGCRSLQLSDG
jgi:Domain of unknown function (DUF6471)